MYMKTRLPLYTPSLLDSATLEAIFVKREPLLQSLLEAHQLSVTTANKHFSLFIGPRGIGKTHLLSLFFHRLEADPLLADNTLIAWLREEEWGIAGYLDLLIHILNSLDSDSCFAGHFINRAAQMDRLYELEEEDAIQHAEQLLLQLVGDKTLLLISENMDLIFDGLGKDGQHQFRAFIQNSAKITIVAAAQSLFTGVTIRTSPFYGFFDIQHLQPLLIDEAVELLINIAEFDKKPDLVAMLKSAKGRVRVRALHHLANGNPRIYVTFSQLIQADSLDQFTDVVLQMLDELTPYYQAKMLQIPPQQRKLVQFLCRQQGATQVTDIAKYTHLKHQAASAQLKKLRDGGYVTTTAVGRASYYEIAEPLMRLVLEVKEARATPVRLLINFLRHWFSSKELHQFADDGQCQVFGKVWLGKEFVMEAIELNREQDFYPQLKSCINDYMRSLVEGDSGNLGIIAEDLAELGESPAAVEKAQPEAFLEAFNSQLMNLVGEANNAKSIKVFDSILNEMNYLHRHHASPKTDSVANLIIFIFLAECYDQIDIDRYRQVAGTIKRSVVHIGIYVDAESWHQSLIDSFQLLIKYQLKQNKYEFALLIYRDILELAETIQSITIWRSLTELKAFILFKHSGFVQSCNEFLPAIDRLTQLEIELNDEKFAVALVHLLNATSLMGLSNNQSPEASVINSVRIYADKYDSNAMWTAYAHAIACQMLFVANDNNLSFTRMMELDELASKYKCYNQLFRGAFFLWTTSASRAISFKQLLVRCKYEEGVLVLVEITKGILYIMSKHSSEDQRTNSTLLWQKLSDEKRQDAFISGISQAGVRIAKDKPQEFSQWFDNLSPLLKETPELQHSLYILTAIKNYLDNENDESKLLVLQKEERALIREGLGLT
ncbi:MAG: MarR family transcriptional regulator [Psychrosphaera sp.]|nr:MarR family transcriptional regulator [Psychrosphaera sp.]